MRLDGTNGIIAEMQRGFTDSEMNYFSRIWVRPQNVTNGEKQTIMEIPNSNLECYFLYPNYQCQNTRTNSIRQVSVENIILDQWIHIAISGKNTSTVNYIKIDYQDSQLVFDIFDYLDVSFSSTQWLAYLGIDANSRNGFVGGLREFLFYSDYVFYGFIDKMKNMRLFWDVKMLAYYSFNMGSLNDEFRQLSATLVKNNEIRWFDYLPNDMCYPVLNQSSIAYLNASDNTDGSIVQWGAVSTREEFLTIGYSYSVAMWMRVDEIYNYTTDTDLAKSTYFLMKMEKMFDIWFPDENSIQLYIEQVAPLKEKETVPLFFPIGKWASFQFYISQIRGYEVRVYNQQKKVQSKYSERESLSDQEPTGRFQLLNNFRGYIKSFILYKNLTGFPVPVPTTNEKDIFPNVMIYYKFDQQNFKFSISLESLLIYEYLEEGQSLRFARRVPFEQLDWDESISDFGNFTYGGIQSSASLFDGLACNDQNYTLYLQGNDSYIRYDGGEFNESLEQLTVELWFKRAESVDAENYILTLDMNNVQYFKIFQNDNQSLICQPFINNEIIGEYTGYNYSDTDWQHIACKYTTLQELSVIYEKQGGTRSFNYYEFLDFDRVVPAGNMSIYLGNSKQLSQGQSKIYFKQVRIWERDLSSTEIIKNTFQSLRKKDFNNLLFYFKMGTGKNYFYNLMDGIEDLEIKYESRYLFLEPESTGLICPSNSYYQPFESNCVKNPMIEMRLYAFGMRDLDSLFGANYILTVDFSFVANAFILEEVTFDWSISQEERYTQTDPFETSPSIRLFYDQMNQNQFNPLEDYQIRQMNIQVMASNEINSFQNLQTQTITFEKCRLIVDKNSQLPITDLVNTQYVNISIEFDILTLTEFPDCISYDSSTVSFRNLTFDIQPSFFDPIIRNGSQININYTTEEVSILIPKNVTELIFFDQVVTIVFALEWRETNAALNFKTYLAYNILFTNEVKSQLSIQYTNILIDQTSIVEAKSSYYIQNETFNSTLGLSYQWLCPIEFTLHCIQYQGLRSLLITPEDLDLLPLVQRDVVYSFQLVVWKTDILNKLYNDSNQIDLTWVNARKPDFSIQLVSSNNKVITTQENQFQLVITNYEPDSDELVYKWEINPSVDDSFLNYSSDQSIMFVKSGAFNQNTSYFINVILNHYIYVRESVNLQQYQFQTSSPPSGGLIFVQPNQGFFLETNFTVRVYNWISQSGNVYYELWGNKAINSSELFLISTQRYSQATDEQIYLFLPILRQVVIKIFDDSGEYILENATITTTINPSTPVDTIFTDISSITDDSQKYQGLYYLTEYMQSLGSITFDDSVVKDTLTLMQEDLEALINDQNFQDMANLRINFNATSQVFDSYKETLQYQAKVLEQALVEPSFIDEEIYNASLTILLEFQKNQALFNDTLQDETFKETIGKILQNLQTYLNDQFQSSQSRRRLAIEENVDAVTSNYNNLKDLESQTFSIADSICSQLTEYEQKTFIEQDSFSLIVEKFNSRSDVEAMTYSLNNFQGNQIIIPIQTLLESSQAFYEDKDEAFTEICVQVALLGNNSIPYFLILNN